MSWPRRRIPQLSYPPTTFSLLFHYPSACTSLEPSCHWAYKASYKGGSTNPHLWPKVWRYSRCSLVPRRGCMPPLLCLISKAQKALLRSMRTARGVDFLAHQLSAPGLTSLLTLPPSHDPASQQATGGDLPLPQRAPPSGNHGCGRSSISKG